MGRIAIGLKFCYAKFKCWEFKFVVAWQIETCEIKKYILCTQKPDL